MPFGLHGEVFLVAAAMNFLVFTMMTAKYFLELSAIILIYCGKFLNISIKYHLLHLDISIVSYFVISIFVISSISNEKPSISVKIPSISMDFDRITRYFESGILKY